MDLSINQENTNQRHDDDSDSDHKKHNKKSKKYNDESEDDRRTRNKHKNDNFVSSDKKKSRNNRDESTSEVRQSQKHKKKTKEPDDALGSEDRSSKHKKKPKEESDSEMRGSSRHKKHKDESDSEVQRSSKHKKHKEESDSEMRGKSKHRKNKDESISEVPKSSKHKKHKEESDSEMRGKSKLKKPKDESDSEVRKSSKHKKRKEDSNSDEDVSDRHHKKHKHHKRESVSDQGSSSKHKKLTNAEDTSDSDHKHNRKSKKKKHHRDDDESRTKSKSKKHHDEEEENSKSDNDSISYNEIKTRKKSIHETNALLEKIIKNMGHFEKLKGEELKKELDRQDMERQKRIQTYLNFELTTENNDSILSEDFADEIIAIQNEIKAIGDGIKQKEENVAEYKDEKNRATLAGKRQYLRFRLVEKENMIDALAYKCKMFTDKYEGLKQALMLIERSQIDKKKMKKYGATLLKLRDEIIEANGVIDKVQNMAHELLPINVSRHCKKVDDTRKRLIEMQDDLLEKKYFAKKKVIINVKEIEALNIAIDGETHVKSLLDKRKREEIQRLLYHRMRTEELETIIEKCNEQLVLINLTLEEAQVLTRHVQESSTKNRKKQIEEEEVMKDTIKKEKIKELKVNNKMIKKEIEQLKKSIATIEDEFKQLKTTHEFDKKNVHLMEELQTEIRRRRELNEKLQSERVLRKAYYNQVEDMKGAIRVYCRVRPISSSEKQRGDEICFDFPDVYSVSVKSKYKKGQDKNKEYLFDQVFPLTSTQEDIFKDVDRLLEIVFTGFNVCIFAYGQTGSGKTYTLIGDMANGPNMGIVPRAFKRIFDLVERNKKFIDVECNFHMLELYNDKLLDLMKSGAEYSEKLEIKKNEIGMVVVPGISLRTAKSADDMVKFFHDANQNRHIASTKMNSESSRSHLILTVIFKFIEKKSQKKFFGKLSIIDLAGSERSAKSGVTGIHMAEATAINKALTSLGDVISALTQANKGFVPYRNHKLTQLMQDSLGGTAKTLMIVNLSPVDYNLQESISSLNYATRVKTITNEGARVVDNDEMKVLKDALEKLSKGENIIVP